MKKIIMAQSILQDIEGSETIFKRKGIMLFPAWSSEEMLNLHGVKRADLIIIDAALPLMGGSRLCSLLRSDAELKDVSIIAVCEDNETSLSQCREAGANAVMGKPVDAGALLWKASALLVIPQRKDMRVLLRVSIQGVEGNTPLFANSQNISISGMQLETDRVLKVGDQLKCAFNIVHSEVSVTCMVTRVESTVSGRHRYGVRFMDCDTKALVIIEQFVKAPSR
jgi:CheY-like chemotaxis protein